MQDNTQKAFDIITRNFEIQHTDALNLEDAKAILAERIRELLDKNVEKLIGILYRVDINQKKIDEIFDNISKDEIAVQISDAVIQRQLLKIQTREIYKNRGQREIE